MLKKVNFVLLIIILLGLCLRLYRINQPLFEFYPSRQIQTADITRNLTRTGFDILNPTVSFQGAGYVPFMLEFPGYNYVVALFYKAFGVNEVIGRLVSIVGWFAATVLIYLIGRRFGSQIMALIAVLFYTLSPLSVLVSRSFQPDQWMLTFSLAGIFFFLRWKERRVLINLLLSITFIAISILLKLPAVIFTLFPILLFLAVRSKNLKTVGIFMISLTPSILWYGYAYFHRQATQVTMGSFSLSDWFGFEVFLNPKYYSNVFGFEYNLVLLPIGIILFAMGLVQKLNAKQKFMYFWLTGAVLYFLVFNKHNMTHEYYHLPILPIASLFIGIAGEKVLSIFGSPIIPKKAAYLVLSGVLLLLMIIPTEQRAYNLIDRFRFVTTTASIIKKVTKPNDLVIGSMDAGPSLVYYSDRHGWGFDIQRDDIAENFAFYGIKGVKVNTAIEELERLKSQGATVFASANYMQFNTNASFAKYMYSNYPVIAENDNFVIFSLTSTK